MHTLLGILHTHTSLLDRSVTSHLCPDSIFSVSASAYIGLKGKSASLLHRQTSNHGIRCQSPTLRTAPISTNEISWSFSIYLVFKEESFLSFPERAGQSSRSYTEPVTQNCCAPILFLVLLVFKYRMGWKMGCD